MKRSIERKSARTSILRGHPRVRWRVADADGRDRAGRLPSHRRRGMERLLKGEATEISARSDGRCPKVRNTASTRNFLFAGG